jgi:C4-dicarboxylate-specific signal transduction histidine kinase
MSELFADVEPVKEEPLRPWTPREALLMIRARIAATVESSSLLMEIDELLNEGLATSANFELSDTLADRLAEAHEVLRVFASRRNGEREDRRVAEALALPPDLEAMIERRIGPR